MTMLASRKFINYIFQKIVDAATYTPAGFVKYCPKITQGTKGKFSVGYTNSNHIEAKCKQTTGN